MRVRAAIDRKVKWFGSFVVEPFTMSTRDGFDILLRK